MTDLALTNTLNWDALIGTSAVLGLKECGTGNSMISKCHDL